MKTTFEIQGRLMGLLLAAMAATTQTASAQTIDCACSGTFSVGDRVVALTDNPSGASGITAGAPGTVVCGADGGTPLLIQWDNWTQGHDGNGYCICGGSPDATSDHWYVECTEVAGTVVTNVTQGILYATLQEALDDAVPGDAIEISAGTLFEDNIVFPNGLDVTIRGAGMDQTFIDGGNDDADRVLNLNGTAQNSATVISDLTITNAGGGDGVYIAGGTPTLRRVRFLSCDGNNALEVRSASLIDRCIVTGGMNQADAVRVMGDADFVQCLFADNDAIRTIRIDSGAPKVTNCTIVGPGAAVTVVGTTVDLVNSVIIGALQLYTGGSFTASRCLYAGATGDNIDGVPTFVDAAGGDYRLAAGSLGIDAADLDAYATAGGGLFDLNGDVRIRDNLGTANTGSGRVTYLDIGAFEFAGTSGTPTVAPDLDGDGDVDSGDFALFVQCFGGSNNPPGPGCPF